jgi:hypothetical protein
VQVVPPPEYCPRKNYDTIDFTIKHPIKQVVTGGNGMRHEFPAVTSAGYFSLFNVETKGMSIAEFKDLANSETHRPPKDIEDNPEELERKFW